MPTCPGGTGLTDSGDHLHPGDGGTRAMAEAIRLSILGRSGLTPAGSNLAR